MGEFVGVCPRDDAISRVSADWYARLNNRLAGRHTSSARTLLRAYGPAERGGLAGHSKFALGAQTAGISARLPP
jgi:hypothetical protein